MWRVGDKSNDRQTSALCRLYMWRRIKQTNYENNLNTL
jgi:hypothetical protein